jgi:hypothetical protein
MRARTLYFVGCLFAGGCTNSTPLDDSARSRQQQAALTSEERGRQPDTAFIETRRFTRQGVRTAEGGCRFSSADSGRPGERHELRTVSIDRKTCTSVVALGYRKVWPEPDTVGVESRSASTDIDSAAVAQLKRKP